MYRHSYFASIQVTTEDPRSRIGISSLKQFGQSVRKTSNLHIRLLAFDNSRLLQNSRKPPIDNIFGTVPSISWKCGAGLIDGVQCVIQR
mmetsp:Transcript_25107/g.58800  ORF Transcript_25107/g.58800 Transcript_25107/m.58800 type:complete len:89 (+) Transcript_25107:47-313(+)